MIRIAVIATALSVWLAVALGVKTYFGAVAYATSMMGSNTIAQQMLDRALAHPEAVTFGMDPWTMLAAGSVAAGYVLVLGVFVPFEAMLRKFKVARTARLVVLVALAVAATGAALLAVHPVLSMPTVPEGPRTMLNYACEAAGYGWVNAIAHGGAVAAAVAFVAMGPSAAAVTAASSGQASGQTPDGADPEAEDAALDANDSPGVPGEGEPAEVASVDREAGPEDAATKTDDVVA